VSTEARRLLAKLIVVVLEKSVEDASNVNEYKHDKD
jgi:hypothetical protein